MSDKPSEGAVEEELKKLLGDVDLNGPFPPKAGWCNCRWYNGGRIMTCDYHAAIEQRLAETEAKLAECEKNCMGAPVDGVRTWVAKERLDAVEAKLREAEEMERELVGALEWCTDRLWPYGVEIDEADFNEEMERRGLLVSVPASPEFRDEWDADTMLVWKWSSLAAGEDSDGEG